MAIIAKMLPAINNDRTSKEIISLQWLWLVMVITDAVFRLFSHDIHVSVL